MGLRFRKLDPIYCILLTYVVCSLCIQEGVTYFAVPQLLRGPGVILSLCCMCMQQILKLLHHPLAVLGVCRSDTFMSQHVGSKTGERIVDLLGFGFSFSV